MSGWNRDILKERALYFARGLQPSVQGGSLSSPTSLTLLEDFRGTISLYLRGLSLAETDDQSITGSLNLCYAFFFPRNENSHKLKREATAI